MAYSDRELLARLIQCEAGGESYDGKLAVGSVVINRVKSSYFPNSVSGVIYQSGQFSPVASGRLAYRLEAGVDGSCLQAAQDDPRQLRTALVVAFEMRSPVRPDAAAERLGNVMQKCGPAQHPHAAPM